LAVLGGIEFIRFALSERLLQGFDAKTGIQGVRAPQREHIPTVSGNYNHQVQESPGMGMVAGL